jgi:hypothetical protein
MERYTGKTEDTLVCLHGNVNGCAEKTKGYCSAEMITILVFFGQLIAQPPLHARESNCF